MFQKYLILGKLFEKAPSCYSNAQDISFLDPLFKTFAFPAFFSSDFFLPFFGFFCAIIVSWKPSVAVVRAVATILLFLLFLFFIAAPYVRLPQATTA